MVLFLRAGEGAEGQKGGADSVSWQWTPRLQPWQDGGESAM